MEFAQALDKSQSLAWEAFSLFEAMIAHLREAVTAQLMRVEIIPPEEQQPVLPPLAADSVADDPVRTCRSLIICPFFLVAMHSAPLSLI